MVAQGFCFVPDHSAQALSKSAVYGNLFCDESELQQNVILLQMEKDEKSMDYFEKMIFVVDKTW